MTDDQLREAAGTSQNLRQLLDAVGLVGRGGNYALYRVRLLRIGVDDPRFHAAERRPEPTIAQLVEAAASSRSVAEVCRRLALPATGRAHARVAALLTEHAVDTRHFLGRRANLGRRDLPARGRPLGELLQRGTSIRSSALKARLLRERVLEPCCSGCGGADWQGHQMPLELDHVNGDASDNRRENLRLLCPNCHALTDTWRGRNIGRRPS